MRLHHLSLAVLFSSIFLPAAFAQQVPLPPQVPAEILPAPEGAGTPVDPRTQLGSEVAYIVPKERAVTVNLAVDRPPIPRTAQFKLKRSGEVLAEKSLDRPERLEFEVVIEGPVCDLPVYLPVSEDSSLSAVYAEYGESNPELVVDELAKLGVPDVSVIAILRTHGTERYDGDGFLGVDGFHSWIPFYRVAFKDAATPPVLVKVPRVDCDLYRMTQRSASNNLHHDFELLVLTISDGNPDPRWPACQCAARGYAKCRCRPEHRPYPQHVSPEPANRIPEPAPAEPAPADPLPAAPAGDPFTDDAA